MRPIGDNEPIVTQVPSMYPILSGTEIDWQFTTEPEAQACLSSPGRRCRMPRGKVVGGTSTINGMCYVRGTKADYDRWASLGNFGWTFDEVLPYYKLSENNRNIDRVDRDFHATGGPLTVSDMHSAPFTYSILRASKELGI